MLRACGVRAIFVQTVHGSRCPSAVGTVDFSRLQCQAAGMAKTTLGLRASVMALLTSKTQPAIRTGKVTTAKSFGRIFIGSDAFLGVLLQSLGWPRPAKAATPAF